MTTAFLAPAPIQNTFFIPGSNTPGNGVQVFFYVAGSVSTKQTVYQDNTASVAWSNPIVLDSGGNLPTGTKEVWFPSGLTYKAVYAPSNDTDPPVSPYLSLDNLSGINDVTSSVSEWISGPAPTFVSGTTFSLAGDQTLQFTLGRRLKATVTAGTVYGTITGTLFSGGITTVNMRNDSGALDAGLSAIAYGILQAANPSIPTVTFDQPTQTIASSSTALNLSSTGARSIIVSSTNSISTIPVRDGQIRTLEFDQALTIFHSATTLPVPGAVNITTAPGDTAIVRGESGLTRILMYSRASGIPVAETWQLVSTMVASSSASLTVTGLAGFSSYAVIVSGILPASSNAGLLLACSTSNGATFDNGTNYFAAGWSVDSAAGSGVSVSGNGITSMPMSGGINSTFARGINATVFSSDLGDVSKEKSFEFHSSYFNGTNFVAVMGMGHFGSSVAVTALRFQMTSGSMNSGKIKIYGLR